jgi:hypothetical protein
LNKGLNDCSNCTNKRLPGNTAFDKVQQFFVKEVRPASKWQWRKYQKQHKDILPRIQPNVTDALNEACLRPTEFLVNVGYAILILIAVILRWFIVRTMLGIALLPFRIMLYPCTFLQRLIFGGRIKKNQHEKKTTIPGPQQKQED